MMAPEQAGSFKLCLKVQTSVLRSDMPKLAS